MHTDTVHARTDGMEITVTILMKKVITMTLVGMTRTTIQMMTTMDRPSYTKMGLHMVHITLQMMTYMMTISLGIPTTMQSKMSSLVMKSTFLTLTTTMDT